MVAAPTAPARMRIGEGRISGALSIVFGSISLGGVLCFLFPEFLTTPEFRAEYDVPALRHVLAACIFTAYGFAVRSLIANSTKRSGLWGASLATLALALGGAGIEAGAVESSPFFISLDWLLLDLIGMALVFVPLELFFPKRPKQTKFHPEWKTDLAYFIMAHLFVQGVAIATQEPARIFFSNVSLGGLRDGVADLPYLAQVLLAVFTADLVQYWMHRLFHSVPYLWRFHAVHHSTRSMDWLAGSRQHFVDVVGTRMVVYLPLYVMGFAPEVLYTYVAIVATHAVMNHTNTRLRYGFLEKFIVSPRIHHWHHSADKRAYGKNYAVHFPWIDRLFGTCYAPSDEWPAQLGLDDALFPKGFVQQHIDPFLRNPEVGQPRGEISTR